MSGLNSYDIKDALLLHFQSMVSTDYAVATEIDNGNYEGKDHLYRFDFMALEKSFAHPNITICEVKVSRSDFQRDVKWMAYSRYCNFLYIACPKGLIGKEELPLDVGLIWVSDDKRVTFKKRAAFRECHPDPDFYLRLIMSMVRGKSVKERTIEAYRYVSGKSSDMAMAGYFKSALVESIKSLNSQLSEYRKSPEDIQKSGQWIKEICDLLRQHGLYAYDGEMAKAEISRLLEKGFVPPELDDSIEWLGNIKDSLIRARKSLSEKAKPEIGSEQPEKQNEAKEEKK